MSDLENGPLCDAALKDLFDKAVWIAKTFGDRRCRILTRSTYQWPRKRDARWSFAFEWGAVRIRAWQRAVIGDNGEVHPAPDEEPSLVVSLRQEKSVRFLGFFPLCRRRFQETFVYDVSGEVARLLVPEGRGLVDLAALIGNLFDGLQKVLLRKALTADQIRALPRKILAKMLKEEY